MCSLARIGLLATAAIASTTAAAAAVARDYQSDDALAACPGYKASNVKTSASGLTAVLTLAGPACNAYGTDLTDLVLDVSYETGKNPQLGLPPICSSNCCKWEANGGRSDTRLHVKISDAAQDVYQVPESVLPRPKAARSDGRSAKLRFNYTESPFSFSVARSDTGEVLFDTSAASLVFESQYLRLRTKLPADPNLYGLGEHSDPFKLKSTNYIRTLWSQDSYAIPEGANLYGNHPIYYEHRLSGTHGVFFLNSNGMDIMIDKADGSGQFLEYNTLGGVFDFYFVAGPTPVAVAQQYAEIVGLPAMMPYWGLGYHNCRYGYQDAFEVAEVVYNYSKASIPLETMWTDIDYMDLRKVLHIFRELLMFSANSSRSSV
jgi:alpha-glucosidase